MQAIRQVRCNSSKAGANGGTAWQSRRRQGEGGLSAKRHKKALDVEAWALWRPVLQRLDGCCDASLVMHLSSRSKVWRLEAPATGRSRCLAFRDPVEGDGMHTHIHAREQAAREGRAYCCRPDLAVNRLNVAIQSLEGRDPTDTQATLERQP